MGRLVSVLVRLGVAQESGRCVVTSADVHDAAWDIFLYRDRLLLLHCLGHEA